MSTTPRPASSIRVSSRLRSRALSVMGLLLSAASLAQTETLLGAPQFDNYSEATYKRVTWDDFKSEGQPPPGWNRWTKGSFAHISCDMRLGAFEMADREEGGEWVAVAVGLRPYAVMDKFHSAVRPGSRNDEALAHEQLHFDIAELSARRLTVEMAAVEGRGATAQEARVDLSHKVRDRFGEAQAELQKLQESYDEEVHGDTRRGRQQAKWNEKVAGMFKEATEGLEKLLDERAATTTQDGPKGR